MNGWNYTDFFGPAWSAPNNEGREYIEKGMIKAWQPFLHGKEMEGFAMIELKERTLEEIKQGVPRADMIDDVAFLLDLMPYVEEIHKKEAKQQRIEEEQKKEQGKSNFRKWVEGFF